MKPNQSGNRQFDIQPGDLIFTVIPFTLFKQVATATQTWTNHVGWVYAVESERVLVAESRFPLSQITTLENFIQRSGEGRFAIKRLHREIDSRQLDRLRQATRKRLGKWYHTGFNYQSSRQFCSKFVFDIYREALNIQLGEMQSFAELLQENPQANLNFWRCWYFGRIPWARRTITPAALLDSPLTWEVPQPQTFKRCA